MFYLGATFWNALPRNVRLCDDIDSFKLEINNIITIVTFISECITCDKANCYCFMNVIPYMIDLLEVPFLIWHVIKTSNCTNTLPE